MSRDFLYGMAFMFGCYCALNLLAYLIGRAWRMVYAVQQHHVTTLPQPGPPAHWPGCEQEGCNCWTCGKHYLCPKGSHRRSTYEERRAALPLREGGGPC